jgi:uridine kinase
MMARSYRPTVQDKPASHQTTLPQAAIFETIWNEVCRRRSQAAPFVVGITGIDAAGKTRFTQALGTFIAARGCAVETIHLDAFHHPRHIRRRGPDEIENYYMNTFDLERLQALLLRPIREHHRASTTFMVLDLETDQYTQARRYNVEPGTLVLLEGVFLMRPELASFIDYMVFLHITPEQVIKRAEVRDRPRFGAEIIERYKNKYLPAQMRYLATFPPEEHAGLIVDNTDWADPVITMQHSA